MNQRISLFALVGMLLAAPGIGASADRPKNPPTRPNVIFLLADDMRPESLRALGDRIVQTPNLDALAERGMVFRNAYNLGGNSAAVCLPSRNMILSGRAYFRWKDSLPTGMNEKSRGLYASGDDPNLPVSFRSAGYETWMFSKRGNDAPLIQRKFEHVHYLKYPYEDRQHGQPGREVIDGALDFLARRSGDRPFLMYLAFGNPHDPRVAAEQYRNLYDPAKLPLPTNYQPVHPFDNGEMLVRDELLLPWPRTEAAIRATWRDYYATISGLDAQVGRLLAALRERGLDGNTLIAFSADQGIAIGSHGLLGKQNLYEHSVKAPLFIAGPGIQRGQSDALVYLFDIFPTLCELAGVPVPRGLDGMSFKPVIEGGSRKARSELLLSYRDVQRGLRDAHWKLIRYPQVDVTQLFNLQNDPDETRNLANQTEHAARVTDMLDRLKRLQQQFGDSLPLRVENPKPAAWVPPQGEQLDKLLAPYANKPGMEHMKRPAPTAPPKPQAATPPPISPVKTGVILVNHVGFPPNAPKHCVIPSPPEKHFTIHRLKDTEWTQVFAGTLTQGGQELEPGWVGNFSALKDDGIYQVRCGSLRSRCFTIHAGVYDVPMRVMFNYFTWARCGDTTKSWAGPCHLDDGKLAPAGEHRDFSGGYHQSSDLRKWAALEIIGPLGLVEFAQQQAPHWDNGSIAEEVRWGCDYFQKLVRDDGGMFDSVFIPLGWGPRDFYPTNPPAPALWNNIRLQATAAAYFQSRDAAYAAKCEEKAQRVWRYMTSAKRPKGKYEIPAYPPRGHSKFNEWFAGYYENSALDLGQRICAALALHRLNGNATLLEDAVRSAAKLVALQTAETGAAGEAAGCFWEGPESDGLAENRFLSTGASIQVGLCELLSAAPTHPDAARWLRAVERIADQHLQTANRNPWGLMATKWVSQPMPVKRTQASKRDGYFDGGILGSRTPDVPKRFAAYLHRHSLYHQDIMTMALFMRRAAAVTGREEYRIIAQRQLDWVMGCNPFDASAIEGVGYNQPQRGLFGEFFPPTPQIPGAVSIGLAPYSFDPMHYGFSNEYDLPAAGSVLWLTAEQAKQP